VDFGDISRIRYYGDLENVASEIKVISEVEADKNFEELKSKLKICENIVFLGFGFHPNSMSRIGFDDFLFKHRLPKFYATTFGLGKAQIEDKFVDILKTNFDKSRVSKNTFDNYIVHDSLDNWVFLKEHFKLSNLFK
jgi:hypothetical protein